MKVWYYVLMSAFLGLLFEMAGIPVGSEVLSYIGISSTGAGIKSATMYLSIFATGGFFVGIVGAIVIGTFTKASPENYIILGFITAGLTIFTSTFVGILNITAAYSTWLRSIILLIIGPLTVGYIVSMVEFFRGTD